MRALLLLLFTLLAGPATAQDSVSLTGCTDGQADCRAGCTIDYGGSTRTYDKLGACLQKCKQKYDKCRENQLKIQEREELNLGPESLPVAPPAETEKPADPSGSTRGDGVYRASEAAPEPQPEPNATPEPGTAPESQEAKPAAKASESKLAEPEPIPDTTDLDRLFDEQQPPPPPPPAKTKAKAKAKRARSKPPPESQTEDLTDWVPDAK